MSSSSNTKIKLIVIMSFNKFNVRNSKFELRMRIKFQNISLESFQQGGEGFNSPGAFARTLGATGGSGRSFTASTGSRSNFGGSTGSSGFQTRTSIGSSSTGTGSGYATSGNSFIQEQQMIEIPSSQSTFTSNYLPPNRRI
jgi:hypothetical protein